MIDNQTMPGDVHDAGVIEVPGKVEDVEVVFEVVSTGMIEQDIVADESARAATPPPLEESDTVKDDDAPAPPKPAVAKSETRMRPEGYSRSATASRARKTRKIASVMQEHAKTGYRMKKGSASSSTISPALILIAAFLLVAIAALAFYFFAI